MINSSTITSIDTLKVNDTIFIKETKLIDYSNEKVIEIRKEAEAQYDKFKILNNGDNIKIIYDQSIVIETLSIMNLTGQKIENFNENNGEITINNSQLTNGMYLVVINYEIRNNKFMKVLKFIKD